MKVYLFTFKVLYIFIQTILCSDIFSPITKMSERTEMTLKNFYIYNDAYGQTEGEEDQKIMYYFPPKVNLDEKMKNVGLSEAIIQFTETFSTKRSCDSMHTQKTRHFYYKPEPHFYIVMTVNVPTNNSIEGTEYYGEEVQDNVCLAVIKQAYSMYKLFHNTLTSSVGPDGDTSMLKEKMERFFNKYLSSLKIQNSDVMDIFQGVQFLPLDSQTFLHVQCFVNLLEATFSIIEFTAFLYNDRLIWSGLEPEDMQVLFHYIVFTLLPKHTSNDVSTNGTPQTSCYGRFITGPENVHSCTNNIGKVPKVFLCHVKPCPATYHLVVYKSSNCTVCLFVPESAQLTMETFRKWDMFLGPRLTKLMIEVSDYTTRQPSVSPTPGEPVSRFVYFNRMNLATKSTIHLDTRRTGNTAVTPQILRVLANINAEHSRCSNDGELSAETIIKTTTDYWVVGKLSNAREFYVVIQHKNANLIEINDEVKRICDNELKNIFFHV